MASFLLVPDEYRLGYVLGAVSPDALGHDPYELFNRYDASGQPARLASRLQALKTCAGDGYSSAVRRGRPSELPLRPFIYPSA